MFGFGKKSRRRLPSKSTDIYALGMTIFEASTCEILQLPLWNSRFSHQVVTRRPPFDHIRTDAVYMHVIGGGRPDRPTVGFSDVLWGLLVQSWYDEHESMLPRRPPISLLRAQLEQDGRTWVSPIGLSRTTTIIGLCFLLSLRWRPCDSHPHQADDMTPLSPVGDTDPTLQVLLKQVQEFLGTERPITPVVVPTPAPTNQVPARGSQKGGSLQRFRDKFRLLLAKFNRASGGPITLSRGLVPEREENAEIAGGRFTKLFS